MSSTNQLRTKVHTPSVPYNQHTMQLLQRTTTSASFGAQRRAQASSRSVPTAVAPPSGRRLVAVRFQEENRTGLPRTQQPLDTSSPYYSGASGCWLLLKQQNLLLASFAL